jgi:hypothetical protein
MAYVGREPLSGEVIIMNSIESQFNGVLTSFTLQRTVSGTTLDFYPAQTHQLLVSLGGVIQKPDPTGNTGFKIEYNKIIFAVAPLTGTSCFIVSYGNVLDIGTPADGSVTPAKLSTGGPSWNTGSTITTNPIQMNPNTVAVNATIPTNYNAESIGPNLTINSGVSVTVQSGGTWTIT